MIDSADIEATLKDIQNQIDHNQHNLDNLLEQRKQIVIQGYNNGLSMIKIGQLLDVTRQRVYAIINTEEE